MLQKEIKLMRKKLEAMEDGSADKCSVVSKSSHEASMVDKGNSNKLQSRFSLSNDKRSKLIDFKSASAGKHLRDFNNSQTKPELSPRGIYDSSHNKKLQATESKAGSNGSQFLGKRLLNEIKNSVLQEKRGSLNLPLEGAAEAIQIDADEGKQNHPEKKRRGRKPKNKQIQEFNDDEKSKRNTISTRRNSKKPETEELAEGEAPAKKTKA